MFMFRKAGNQVSPVSMSLPSLRAAAPPCLPLGIKDSLKENLGLFALGLFAVGFCFGGFCFRHLLEAFTFGF
jgi:hypothetical protein